MTIRRFHLSGLFAVLLALVAQVGAGSVVPRIDPASGMAALCQTRDGAPLHGNPSPAPVHPADCPVCPLCLALHAPPSMLASADTVLPPAIGWTVIRPELPPPATAPPVPHRPPGQPRAPPIA